MAVLSEANEEEKAGRDVLSYEAWGAGLSAEQYLARERALRAHRWPASGAMTTWALRDGAGRIVASCETFAVPAALDGTPRGRAYAVASVYAEPALRGRGHATALMRALGDELRARDPHALAAVLFSDVGVELYARAGYAPRPAIDRVAAPAAGEPADGVDELFTAEGGALDRAAAELFPAPARGLWLAPSGAQADWHRERERLYARAQGRPPLGAWGARRGGGALLWAADWKHERLCGLFYRATSEAEATALLGCARRVAARAGLAHVVLWHDPAQPWPSSFAARERADAIPMLRPFAPDVAPDAWSSVPRGTWVLPRERPNRSRIARGPPRALARSPAEARVEWPRPWGDGPQCRRPCPAGPAPRFDEVESCARRRCAPSAGEGAAASGPKAARAPAPPGGRSRCPGARAALAGARRRGHRGAP
jgi:GNAT superfamily N-acetyltransferase